MKVYEKYYSIYIGSREGFIKFHNEVINMPRDQFSGLGLKKIRSLAGYLLLTKGKLDPVGVDYKETLKCINNELLRGNFPKYRDIAFENRYLNLGLD